MEPMKPMKQAQQAPASLVFCARKSDLRRSDSTTPLLVKTPEPMKPAASRQATLPLKNSKPCTASQLPETTIGRLLAQTRLVYLHPDPIVIRPMFELSLQPTMLLSSVDGIRSIRDLEVDIKKSTSDILVLRGELLARGSSSGIPCKLLLRLPASNTHSVLCTGLFSLGKKYDGRKEYPLIAFVRKPNSCVDRRNCILGMCDCLNSDSYCARGCGCGCRIATCTNSEEQSDTDDTDRTDTDGADTDEEQNRRMKGMRVTSEDIASLERISRSRDARQLQDQDLDVVRAMYTASKLPIPDEKAKDFVQGRARYPLVAVRLAKKLLLELK